jgi:hypothetical protein
MKFTPAQQRAIDAIIEQRLASLRRVHEAEIEVLAAEARQAAELDVMFEPRGPGKLLRWPRRLRGGRDGN